MTNTFCTTCGGFDTAIQTSDNEICSECGDTEGITWSDRFTEQEWEQLVEEYELRSYFTGFGR